MTLVPIIYTSLLIFSAILVFVILVSYISFKARSAGRRPEIHAVKHTMAARPVNSQKYQAPAIVHADNFVQNVKVISKPVYFEPSQTQKKQIVVNIDRSQLERQSNFDNFQGRRVSQNRQRSTREDRIAILNDTNQFKTTSYVSRSVAEKSNQKLPDLNLLNYYSDRTDSDFITLTA